MATKSERGNFVPTPEGISSLLDTDLYKLTMQSAVLQHFPQAHVTYKFTNRTPELKLTRAAYLWLQTQVERLSSISLSEGEFQFLKKNCPYLSETYLEYLRSFRFKPREQVKIEFQPSGGDDETKEDERHGDVAIHTEGLWVETILYEIPLLALTSEAYFRFCDRDWSYDGQVEKAYDKGIKLCSAGCIFSDFGSRRRRDYHTQELVLSGLLKAQKEAEQKGYAGKISGTSNVHFAMRFGISPIGTMAHEWFMGIAAIIDDYKASTKVALRHWVEVFGKGVLAVALTDTYGTPIFLDAFGEQIPESSSSDSGNPQNYAEVFTGVRQDSGSPLEYVDLMKRFYERNGIKDKKTIVFSDSLNVDRCLEYKSAAEKAGFQPSFGVGTFFTNDYTHKSDGSKSLPLNIVIKLSSANGRPAVKISDNVGKNTGDEKTVEHVKRVLGYQEHGWEGGDEKTRWGDKDDKQ